MSGIALIGVVLAGVGLFLVYTSGNNTMSQGMGALLIILGVVLVLTVF